MQRLEWVRAEDGLIAGVCKGLAPQFGVSALTLRILWFCSVFMFGTGLIMYAISCICLPTKNRASRAQEAKILGTCVQLSRRFHVEIGLIRCIMLTLFCLSFGLAASGYILLAFLLPYQAPELEEHGRRFHDQTTT